MEDEARAAEGESDASLIAQIAEDRERPGAEAALCARYQRRVYLYGIRHLRDAASAEDLVQDVLATVLQRVRAGAVQEPSKMGAFVLGVSRMLVVNKKRGEARRARLLAAYGDPRAEELAAAWPGSTDGLDVDRVRDCLGLMADRDRTVLLLSFYAELDAAAIGRELGAEPSHVRVMRHRALGRLQNCVKGPSGTEDA